MVVDHDRELSTIIKFFCFAVACVGFVFFFCNELGALHCGPSPHPVVL